MITRLSGLARRGIRLSLLFYLALVSGTALQASATTGNWTWVAGTASVNQYGVYGTQGDYDSANMPGGRKGSEMWCDGSGSIWLFGGYGWDSENHVGYLNDYWCYNQESGYWAWMKGDVLRNQPGIYGTLGESDASSIPGARYGGVSWVDPSGRFWLFGGQGYDSVGNSGYLNDLWCYEPATGNWTWMKGAVLYNQPGVYGSRNVSDPANTPGARVGAASWSDGNGVLWLFGGYGRDGSGAYGSLNDLWRYDLASGHWTWVRGSIAVDQMGVYQVQGVPDSTSIPGARQDAVSWIDASGSLWLFGGNGWDGSGHCSFLNDLWCYDPVSANWVWMKGASNVNQLGVYGTQGVSDSANTPGSRSEAVSWVDTENALWLFGGSGGASFSDLWRYSPATGNWTWMKGPLLANQPGQYGSLGVAVESNTPGARASACACIDDAGLFWLFGGTGFGSTGNGGYLNDVWRWEAIATTGSLCVTLKPQEACLAGARWSIDGGQINYESGYTLSDLPPGTYTLVFEPNVLGWDAPANQEIQIVAGQTTEVTGTYTRQSGVVNPVWVSYMNGSDQGEGTWESPFRRLAQGWAAVISGGTVFVLGDEPLNGVLRIGDDGKHAFIESGGGSVRIGTTGKR